MPHNIFVYGTLLFDEVWDRVVGGSIHREVAILHGWTRLYVRGKRYPGIRPLQGSEVDGAYIQGVSSMQIAKLDEFEDEIYMREAITIEVANKKQVNAEAYIVKPDYYTMLSEDPWNPDRFESIELNKYIGMITNKNIN